MACYTYIATSFQKRRISGYVCQSTISPLEALNAVERFQRAYIKEMSRYSVVGYMFIILLIACPNLRESLCNPN